MAYAKASDIEDRLGRELDESEATIVETRLEDAEMWIRQRISDIELRIAKDVRYEQALVYVEAEAVLRLIRNPDGLQTETDGNYAYTIDQRVASGRLNILAEEWQLLGVRRGVVVLSPKVDVPWCEGELHPQYPFNPPYYGALPEHPAQWWGDDE